MEQMDNISKGLGWKVIQYDFNKVKISGSGSTTCVRKTLTESSMQKIHLHDANLLSQQ